LSNFEKGRGFLKDKTRQKKKIFPKNFSRFHKQKHLRKKMQQKVFPSNQHDFMKKASQRSQKMASE